MSNSCHRPGNGSQSFPFPALGRLFEDWLGVDIPEANMSGTATIRPAMDLMEHEDGVTLHMELPGLSKEEVDLTLENGVLTIRGDKTLNRDKNNKKYHCMERTFGSFHRAVKLPTGVQAEKAEATFKDGVLTIHVPKTEAVKARKLRIQ